jgi:hypothetical protein
MLQKADLVVIAQYVSTKDTSERTAVPDYTPPLAVIGVVSEFETLRMLGFRARPCLPLPAVSTSGVISPRRYKFSNRRRYSCVAGGSSRSR